MENNGPDRWRSDWFARAETKVLAWDDLANRISSSGYSEQAFWRGLPQRSGEYSDAELESHGVLKRFGKKLYHVAYIPWRFGQKFGKEVWSEGDWARMNEIVNSQISRNSHLISQLNWEHLNIHGDIAKVFIQGGIRNSHIVGGTSVDFQEFDGGGNLYDGSVNGNFYEIKDATVTGEISGYQNSRVIRSKIGSLKFYGEQRRFKYHISECEINELEIFNGTSELDIKNSEIRFARLENIDIGRISITSDSSQKIGLAMAEATVAGRATFSGIKLDSSVTIGGTAVATGFEYARFEQNLRFTNCEMFLSLLASARIGSQFDIEFSGRNPEDVFETELSEILNQRGSALDEAEDRRRDLERACQIICERHRQDGRKDLEHRFRRMELKARAYRHDADPATRFVTWCYNYFSDFGRSISRPLRGLFFSFTVFSTFYCLMGIIFYSSGHPSLEHFDQRLFSDSILLAVDKIFPFGASVDESKLFKGALVGEEAGLAGAFFGFVGAVQTVFSGIMIFLLGLAVRTKLLIG